MLFPYTQISPSTNASTNFKKYLKQSKIKLDLPIHKIIKLCTLITDQCYFEFNGTFYKQTFGLPMGSALSAPLACLYLELLEAGPFKEIIPSDTHYFRYIDDALIIYPQQVDLKDIVTKLNNVEDSISFTYELESDNSLPYLDIQFHRKELTLRRSVYRKPTHSNDHINYYSHHSTDIKSGVLIGFFLRALRICTPEHLPHEEDYICSTFKTLNYPHHFIRRARRKAYKIHTKSNSNQTNEENKRRITLPTNNITSQLKQNLENSSFQIITTTSSTIKNIVIKRKQKTSTSNACIYRVPCRECSLGYIGETSGDVKSRIYEHKRDLIKDNKLNALVQHRNLEEHNFDLRKTDIIKYIHSTNVRRCVESAIILCEKTIPQRIGHYHLALPIAKSILRQHKLPHR